MFDELWDEYCDQVYTKIDVLFEEQVKPFCKLRKLDFLAGNGTWYLGEPRYGGRHPSTENVPFQDRIVTLLSSDVAGMPNNDVGSLMPCFVWKKL